MTLQNILQEYNNNCSEKENCDLNSKINGTRTWVYSLVKNKWSDDSIQWENLPDFITAEFGWLLGNQTIDHDQLEWLKMKSHDLCDGQRIIYQLSIFKNWTFTVKVNHREIAKETLGISTLLSSK